MEKVLTPIECQLIMDKLSESHNPNQISMYQNIDHKQFLIVKIGDVSGSDVKKLEDNNLSVCIFGAGMHVELWLSKL